MTFETADFRGDEVAGVFGMRILGWFGSRGVLSGDLKGLVSAEEEKIFRRFGAGVDIVALLWIEPCDEP